MASLTDRRTDLLVARGQSPDETAEHEGINPPAIVAPRRRQVVEKRVQRAHLLPLLISIALADERILQVG